jgi:DNA-binding NarL/FixJ family response regulator
MVPSRTIVIISSQYLVGLGLQKMFESQVTVRIVVQLHPRMSADVRLAENQPDVFLLDMETEPDAVRTIRWMRESAPKSKILLLSGFEDAHSLREAFDCGVDGVILKTQPPAVVLVAIEALYSPANPHAPVKSHDVAEVDQRAISEKDADSHARSSVWSDGLTERQREIIRLIGQGLSNKDIADRLCIADSTVRHHLTGIFGKVGVPNRQKLLIHTRYAHSSPV